LRGFICCLPQPLQLLCRHPTGKLAKLTTHCCYCSSKHSQQRLPVLLRCCPDCGSCSSYRCERLLLLLFLRLLLLL
jgi:hypothetical protein